LLDLVGSSSDGWADCLYRVYYGAFHRFSKAGSLLAGRISCDGIWRAPLDRLTPDVESARPLKLLKYRADRVPVAIFFTLTLIDLAMYFAVQSVWIILAYFVLLLPVKCLVGAWNHHHQHVPMFYSKPLNRLLELSFAMHTGVTTNAWTLHHVHGHHKNYLDQDLDQSRWRQDSGETYRFVPYTLITMLTAYPRAYQVGRSRPRLQRAFVGYSLLTFAILGGLIAYKPVAGLFLFAVPAIISLTVTVAATHRHHSDLDTDDHMAASRNYIGGFRNVLTGNLGYHTAHHYRQGVHWSKLPELHASIAHRIPAELIGS